MAYVLPTTTDYVSCSWECHRDRPTPSVEPGTDYGVGYGNPVFAPGSGTISDLKHDAGGATGRYCTVDMDDGRRTRSLHMSEIWVGVGQRVGQGQQIGLSGGSGFGDNWYYGPHVHQTLWSGHFYEFCSSCTIDFANHVGPGVVADYQRVVGGGSVNGRSQPNTSVPVTQTLGPGTVADMDGWIHGQNVEGNDVWYRGMHSGDWFWSGGFVGGANGNGIADLNTVALEPHQRKATTNVNGRSEPNTSGAIVSSLSTGDVGDFNGWINGESIEGEVRWLRGQHSGAFFSLKYLDPQNTDGLTDLNAPVSSANRTAGSEAVNVRNGPSTTFTVVDSIPAGTVVEMNGFAHGESVQGNDVWFRGKLSNNWAWSGGFTSQSTDGLTEVGTVPIPNPPNSNNPLGLPEYEPVNPAAVIGLEAPLGFNDDGTRASRAFCGNNQVTPVLNRGIIHHTGTTQDQLAYFSRANDRSSCPNEYVRPDGSRYEMIRPGAKPASTGPLWNCRSFAWEVLDETAAPNWLIPEPARRAVAEDIVWLVEHHGQMLDGVRVDLPEISGEYFIGHNEALPGTLCPGPDMDIPGILVMAQAIWDEKHPGTPEPPDPDKYRVVTVEQLQEWRGEAGSTYDEIGDLLEEGDS